MIPIQRNDKLELIQRSSDLKIRKLAIMGVPEYIKMYLKMAGVKESEGSKGKAKWNCDTCLYKSGNSWAPLHNESKPSKEKGRTPGPSRIKSTSVRPSTSPRCS